MLLRKNLIPSLVFIALVYFTPLKTLTADPLAEGAFLELIQSIDGFLDGHHDRTGSRELLDLQYQLKTSFWYMTHPDERPLIAAIGLGNSGKSFLTNTLARQVVSAVVPESRSTAIPMWYRRGPAFSDQDKARLQAIFGKVEHMKKQDPTRPLDKGLLNNLVLSHPKLLVQQIAEGQQSDTQLPFDLIDTQTISFADSPETHRNQILPLQVADILLLLFPHDVQSSDFQKLVAQIPSNKIVVPVFSSQYALHTNPAERKRYLQEFQKTFKTSKVKLTPFHLLLGTTTAAETAQGVLTAYVSKGNCEAVELDDALRSIVQIGEGTPVTANRKATSLDASAQLLEHQEFFSEQISKVLKVSPEMLAEIDEATTSIVESTTEEEAEGATVAENNKNPRGDPIDDESEPEPTPEEAERAKLQAAHRVEQHSQSEKYRSQLQNAASYLPSSLSFLAPRFVAFVNKGGMSKLPTEPVTLELMSKWQGLRDLKEKAKSLVYRLFPFSGTFKKLGDMRRKDEERKRKIRESHLEKQMVAEIEYFDSLLKLLIRDLNAAKKMHAEDSEIGRILDHLTDPEVVIHLGSSLVHEMNRIFSKSNVTTKGLRKYAQSSLIRWQRAFPDEFNSLRNKEKIIKGVVIGTSGIVTIAAAHTLRSFIIARVGDLIVPGIVKTTVALGVAVWPIVYRHLHAFARDKSLAPQLAQIAAGIESRYHFERWVWFVQWLDKAYLHKLSNVVEKDSKSLKPILSGINRLLACDQAFRNN